MRTLVLIAAALLAGCASPPPTGPSASVNPVEPDPAPTTLTMSIDLLINRISLHRVTAVGIGLPGDSNCAWLRDVQHADEFTVTATWDAVTPAWERLEMTVHHDDGQEFLAGASPLTITVHDIRRDSFFEGIGTIVQPEIPGPILDQPVHLEIMVTSTFDPNGAEPELDRSGCAWGRLL